VTDLSTNQPEAWEWQFPGGNPTSSFDQNPSVIYVNAGSYNVSLVATNATGADTLVQQALIIIQAPPVITASITDASSSTSTDGSIEIILNGNPTYAIEWSDGSSNPRLENISAGDYTVTVTDTIGCANSDTLLVGISTSINDLKLAVNYFPNPFCNSLLIEAVTRLNISFYNSLGAVLQDVSLEAGGRFLWGENLQPGIYIMQVTSGSKTGSPIKVVKIK